MKKIGLIGILICFAIGMFGYLSAQQAVTATSNTGEFLAKAFSATKANVEGYSVHNWSVINQDYKSLEELKALGQELNETFGIEQAQETADHEGDQNSYALRGTWKNGSDVQLVLSSLKFHDQAPQTVLVLRVEQVAQDLNDFNASINRVRATATQAGTVPQISTCIKGLLADKMEDGETNALISDVLAKVSAKEIEGVRSDLVSSVSGYSPQTKDYIVTNGNKMNLQVAVHYDEQKGKTRVLVGSPIVTIEY
ncbi:MAG TPA: YwmB family TATA-box binding protein [Bacilli bacterium]|nr:YwmB family TATA-box binding protein [Bacilli bacterium]